MGSRTRLLSLTLSIALSGCQAPTKTASPAPALTASPVASRGTAAPIAAPPASLRRASSAPRREDVVDESFGLRIADPYRWMERADDGELARWMKSEGARARRSLDANPGRAALMARVEETGRGVAQIGGVQIVGERLFYLKMDKGADLKRLIVRAANGVERVLVDPSTIPGAEGGHWSIDHFAASPDGKLVAYGLAQGGAEITSEHVVESETGRARDVIIPHIWGECAVSWFNDGKGFYYTQIPASAFADPAADKLQNMRVLAHALGTPIASDVVVLGPGTTRDVPIAPREFPFVALHRGSSWALGLMVGAHDELRSYLAPVAKVTSGGAWTKLTDYADDVTGIALEGDSVFVVSKKDAPNGQILRLSAAAPKLENAAVVLAQSDSTIESISAAADALYVTVQKDGRSALRRIPYSGGRVEELTLPLSGWIDYVDVDPTRAGGVVAIESWTRDTAYFAFDPAKRSFTELPLLPKGDADFSQIVADDTTVPTGGVDVPLTILHRRDLVLDGSHPTIVFGYGGYGTIMSPTYRPALLPWLERGGVWAIAHVRGGGEKGDAWRKGAWRETKPNAWRDFNASAEWLVQKRYTSKGKLAAYSASAGGILVGRAITERPDLYAAASIYSGIVNASRYMHSSNGANQSFELGPDDTREGLNALLAMDAYQNVRDGAAYPAVMIATGLNDARVSPWMSAKLAARMTAATTSGRPILLRVDGDEGHGVGSRREQRLAFWGDMFTFFLEQMGDPAFAPAPIE